MATLVDLLAAQLARPEVVARVPEHRQQIWQSFENILLHIGGALLQVAQSPPSPGYEPWFVDRGGGRLGARGLALLLAHAGRRRARDHQWHRKAVDALRDLAKPLRYGSAVRDRVDTLLEAWEASSVIETIFDDAGRDVFEFVRLLKAAQAGNISVFNRLAAIAGALRPVLTVPRGPKPSAASEAHALFLEAARDFGGGAYTWNDVENDFTDAQTQATRREFNVRRFTPKRAYQRLKRKLPTCVRGTGPCSK